MYMMEGSRHEKIVLVVLAYVIGFVTALIAFGLHDKHAGTEVVVIKAERSAGQFATLPVENDGLKVRLDDTGLYITRNEDERILSANQASAASAALGTNGFHTNVIGATVSADEQFVYFCEQLEESDTECDPLVYNFDNDSVHKVRVGEETVSFKIVGHDVSWSPGGRLQTREGVSLNTQSPWLLE